MKITENKCPRCLKQMYDDGRDNLLCLNCGKVLSTPPQSPTNAIICFVLLLCVWLVVIWALFNGHFLPF